MKVADLMSTAVATCRPEDSLHYAAERLWHGDCGALPVVDSDENVVGMITDRDVCMGGFTQRRALPQVSVAQSMARYVITCEGNETVTSALEKMAKARVRRVPVVDEQGKLSGILSINDIVRASAAGKVDTKALTKALATIGEQPSPRHLATRGSAGTNKKTTKTSAKPSSASSSSSTTKAKSTKPKGPNTKAKSKATSSVSKTSSKTTGKKAPKAGNKTSKKKR